MSDTTTAFNVSVPAGTPIATPINVSMALGDSDVQAIVVTVPPGAAGLVGFAIWAGGSPAYPNDFNSWFIFDDYTFTQEVSNAITTGQWSLMAYNVDTYQHTLNVYFKYNYLTVSPDLAVSPPVSL